MSGTKSTLKLKKLHFIKNFGKINRRECVHWISNKKKITFTKKKITLYWECGHLIKNLHSQSVLWRITRLFFIIHAQPTGRYVDNYNY
jgi:hypothetical protein